MALSIKTDEADRLARELAELTHESLTEAVTNALRERLERLAERGSIADRLERLSIEYSRLPVDDDRSPDELIGYDDDGLPRSRADDGSRVAYFGPLGGRCGPSGPQRGPDRAHPVRRLARGAGIGCLETVREGPSPCRVELR